MKLKIQKNNHQQARRPLVVLLFPCYNSRPLNFQQLFHNAPWRWKNDGKSGGRRGETEKQDR